jgi:hypothetical protein
VPCYQARHLLVLVRPVSCTCHDLACFATLQHKQAQQPAAPKVAQSFRKPKVEDQERLAREAEREAAYQAARKKKSLAASFASLYGTKVCPSPAMAGHNIPVVATREALFALTASAGHEPASTSS